MRLSKLLIGAIVLTVIGVGQIYQSGQSADKLQNALLAADQAGGDTAAPAAALQAYTSKHMLTGRTVFLAGSYSRAKQAAEAAANPQSNGQIYAQAQAACGGRSDSITQAKCVTNYVSTHSAPQANPQAVAMPNQADYNKKFSSPTWTPSLGGICLIAGIALLASAASMLF